MKSDTRIQHGVLAELHWDPSTNATGIGVQVAQGIVTLTGQVASLIEKGDVERAALQVNGGIAIGPRQLPDRRNTANRPLELLVDTGIVCRSSLGNEAARLLYLSHNIPSTIAVRVLYHDGQRRATGLEKVMLARGQPINLLPLHDLQGY